MSAQRPRVAIIGMACRLPGGVADPEGLWTLLETGCDAVDVPPPERAALGWPAAATDGRVWPGGYLRDIDRFDAAFFGISAREARTIDPQQRLMLELAWHALEDAGIAALRLKGSATGVFIGQWTSDFDNEVLAYGGADFGATIGTGRYASSGRISNILGSAGPSLTLDAACSSSLVAIHLAARAVASGECSMALAGGVNVILNRSIDLAFERARILSASGRCRFGDIARDGYVRSEGAGIVVLKSLAAALADGDRVHAVIAGSAVNNDGGGAGAMGRPSAAAQAALLRAAVSDAGLEPKDIDYVEAHGTGTRAGDRVEMAALSEVYGTARGDGAPLMIGALKTHIGHCEAASGVASLIKAVLVTARGKLPPNLHLAVQDPAIAWTGCSVPTSALPWEAATAPRRAGITTFGVSGTNCHLLIEQAPESGAPAPAEPEADLCLPLSAGSVGALRALAGRYAQLVAQGAAMNDLCWCAATRRSALAQRAVFPATNRSVLLDALRRFADGEMAAAPTDEACAGWIAGGPLDWGCRMRPGAFVSLPLMPWEPASHWPNAAAPAAPPATIESLIRGLIGEVLDMDAEDIDATAPLGELGLTSMHAVDLSDALAAALALRVPPNFVYDHPSLGAMTAAAERMIGAARAPLNTESDAARALLAEMSGG